MKIIILDAKRNDNRILKIAKGSTAGSLSRAFVEFIVDELNLTTILKRFSKVHYGLDEMVIPSLNSDDGLGKSIFNSLNEISDVFVSVNDAYGIKEPKRSYNLKIFRSGKRLTKEIIL